MKDLIDREDLLERFVAYCRLDTQACEESTTRPSSDGQIVLIEKLAEELAGLGLEKPFVDPRGYVYASIPETLPTGHVRKGKAPPVGFIAHVDTAPGVPGQGVSPVVHRGYKGGDIVLPGDPTQVVTTKDNPELEACVDHDLVTTDGKTLLGADDKAGVAEIMALTRVLVKHPEILHGPIRIAFTTDEEIGKGAEHFDLRRFAFPPMPCLQRRPRGARATCIPTRCRWPRRRLPPSMSSCATSARTGFARRSSSSRSGLARPRARCRASRSRSTSSNPTAT
jgi:tripeptide aminopeptidase